MAGALGAPTTAFEGCTVKANLFPLPTSTANWPLVAPASPVLAAVSVYGVPALSILRSEKLATPFVALTIAVPPSVPPAGFDPIATVIAALDVVTVLPLASWTATRTGGVMVAPATTLAGGERVNASLVGVPALAVAVNVIGLPVSVPEATVSVCAPAVGPSVHVTVASPFAPVVTDPDDTFPLPAPGVKVTFTPDTGFPKASTTTTVGAGVAAPPTVPVGVKLLSARSVSAVAAFTVCAAAGDALVRKSASPA
jgi:hypothetical protein